MGGTIDNATMKQMMVRNSASNFISMMQVSYGRDLNEIPPDDWTDALTRWCLSQMPKERDGDIQISISARAH